MILRVEYLLDKLWENHSEWDNNFLFIKIN